MTRQDAQQVRSLVPAQARGHSGRGYRALLVCLVVGLLTGVTPGQTPPRAYVDDSTLAVETLAQLDDLLRAGSRAEASRALQRLLDEQGDRLVPADGQPDLFIPVRRAVHDRLLAEPALLAVYVEQQEPRARDDLALGLHGEVERARLLTNSGHEAALRVAQEMLERAYFESAWRVVLQLETHPASVDLVRDGQAASLARTIAAYVGRESAVDHAERWAGRAGLGGGPPDEPARPDGLEEGDLEALASGASCGLEGIVPSPLHSLTIPAAEAWAGQIDRGVGQRSFWAVPVVLGDTVLFNDGEAVLALDRFTLRQKWRFPAERGDATETDMRAAQRLRNRTRLIEDPTTVTAHDHSVLVAMGNIVSGRREGDDRLVCLDGETGKPRWAIDPGSLTRETQGASVRGPIVTHGDTALIALRKNERSRRTVGVYLAGVSVRDGSVSWVRLLGAVGALPYQQQSRSAQSITVHRGAAYLVDEIGLIAAVDCATGRTLWLRRTNGLSDQGAQPQPWAVHAPVADGDGLVAVAPDRLSVIRFDAESGRLLASRTAAHVGSPHYLLDTTGGIAAVGVSSALLIRPGTLANTGTPGLSIAGTHGGFTGRVLPAGDELLAPVESGVLRYSWASGEPPELISLDATGNIAVSPGQVLVVDDTRLRSYLIWEVASSMLRERIESGPDRAEAAVTYAELAHRAGRMSEIMPAIDLAIETIERAGVSGSARAVASRLFDSTLEIIENAQRRWFDPARRDEEPAAEPAQTSLIAGLIDRLGRLADSPDQRVAHLLVLGRQHDATGKPAESAATYQRILDDTILSATPWRGPRLSVRADLEAERRLHELVRRAGARVYAPFDAKAGAELEAVGPSASVEAYERIARQYPLSAVAVRARLEQASRARELGQQRQSIRAGSMAVMSLRRLVAGGVDVDRGLIGQAYGMQVQALASSNRLEEAWSLASEAAEAHPGVQLLDGGTPIRTDELFDEISRWLADRRLLPRVGGSIIAEDEPQLIRGYTLRPLARPEPGGGARTRFDGVLIVSQADGTLAWHAPITGEGRLERAWAREIDRDPLLLRIDEVSAWVFWPNDTGGWLERLALEDGSSMWVSLPWDTMSAGVHVPHHEENVGARLRFVDPVDGRVRSDELLVTMDSRTILIVERGGRAAGIDSATGETMWVSTLPMMRVHDADTVGGVFAIGGVGKDRRGTFGPMLATLDPRTGEPIHTDDTVPSEVRWVRVTAQGELIAGLQDRVVSATPTEARMNWEINDPQASGTAEAWLVGGRLLVRSPDDELWMADTQTGRLLDAPLETRGRLIGTDRVVVERLGEKIVLASNDGLCVFDERGTLVGIDAFSQPARMLPAVVAEGTLAVLQVERGRFGLGGTRFLLHLMEPDSARITQTTDVRLFGEPSTIDAIDGRLLITAGEATVVLRTAR